MAGSSSYLLVKHLCTVDAALVLVTGHWVTASAPHTLYPEKNAGVVVRMQLTADPVVPQGVSLSPAVQNIFTGDTPPLQTSLQWWLLQLRNSTLTHLLPLLAHSLQQSTCSHVSHQPATMMLSCVHRVLRPSYANAVDSGH